MNMSSAPPLAYPNALLTLPDWLPPNVWPFETRQIEGDGSAIAFADVGVGPVLLFYTGIGSFVWRDVMLRLSASASRAAPRGAAARARARADRFPARDRRRQPPTR